MRNQSAAIYRIYVHIAAMAALVDLLHATLFTHMRICMFCLRLLHTQRDISHIVVLFVTAALASLLVTFYLPHTHIHMYVAHVPLFNRHLSLLKISHA